MTLIYGLSFLERSLTNFVILSAVRRQPNVVEGPHASSQCHRRMEIFHHKIIFLQLTPRKCHLQLHSSTKSSDRGLWTQSGVHRSKSNLYGPCWKSALSSSHCKQVRGPSTPLGCRLAALRMTDQKIAGD